jgi:hypothetical protein
VSFSDEPVNVPYDIVLPIEEREKLDTSDKVRFLQTSFAENISSL